MPNQVDERIKQKRLSKLIKIQTKVAKEINQTLVGKVMEVCYEGIDFDSQMLFGRSEYQTPDVDSIVFFKSSEPVELGNFYKVKITRVFGSDLKGEVVYE